MSRYDHSTTLLLVDDDPSMVRLLAKIIDRSFGDRMQLQSLTDPEEARQWIEQNLVDILVTDLEMPGVNGLELLRCTKRKNPCAQVLFVTGHSTLEALDRRVGTGGHGLLAEAVGPNGTGGARWRTRKSGLWRWREALAGTVAAGVHRTADSAC